MTRGILPFQYQGNPNSNYTSLAGLPLFIEMAQVCGLSDSLSQKLTLKTQGWFDSQIVLSLLMLNLSGGDCVDDIERLESDSGLRTLLLNLETRGMKRKECRAYEGRFRKSKCRAFPSTSAIRRYLELFHHAEEEKKRVEGKAFIPKANPALISLVHVNQTLIDYAQKHRPCEIATLDQDATLAETSKNSAYYCYEKYKAYQPFNTYWHEQRMLLHSEFRDGNVPAGFEQVRLLKESLEQLPQGVRKVMMRSDTAGYQKELLRYCAEGHNKRFGVIEFAISSNVTAEFKTSVKQIPEKDWHVLYKEDDKGQPIKTTQEWAEVSFVPTWAGISKKAADYRYIAIREPFSTQQSLPGIEPIQQELPFQTLIINKADYKLFGLVTNRIIPGNDLINWHRERCGDSEKVHSIEKTDLAGGQFPSNKFGANAAWWHIMVLTYNLIALMQKLVLPKSLATKRMKGLRFHLINLAGCMVFHARSLILKISNDPGIIELVRFVRKKIVELAIPPPSWVIPNR